jgi:hypothetical protein
MTKSDAMRSQGLVDHLGQVHALVQAIASAISAIEKNDLIKFESHLAAQETICNRLAGTNWELLSSASRKAASGGNPDTQLWQEIRQAHLALAQLNRVYAALLKSSRKTMALMAALYRSHGEGYDRGFSPSPQRHTWSCEA